jgi:hypothetical protein
MPDINVLPDPEQSEPSENFDRDLRPNLGAGTNHGVDGPMPEKDGLRAYDIKEFHNRFPEMSSEDLKQIVVIRPGDHLAQGATYIDAHHPTRGVFKASHGITASEDNWFVPKSETDYQVWNRLIGVENPERTGQADD